MPERRHLLSSVQMAEFVARGFLRFDRLVSDEINQAAVREMEEGLPRIPTGTPLSECYPPPSAIGEMLRLPQVRGIIQSLVGREPGLDHHAVHIRRPRERYSQHLHGDSIIDTRMPFDIQLLYFPHDVPPEMGGTLLVPGSHFRRINESDIARYQNVRGQISFVGEAGTLLATHHGIWHCGRQNRTDRVRYMLKVRLNPREKQVRLWNTDDLDAWEHRPLFSWMGQETDDVISVLARPEPWFELATGRLEIVNRIRLWRFLSGDDQFDIDYWLTRLENAPESQPA